MREIRMKSSTSVTINLTPMQIRRRMTTGSSSSDKKTSFRAPMNNAVCTLMSVAFFIFPRSYFIKPRSKHKCHVTDAQLVYLPTRTTSLNTPDQLYAKALSSKYADCDNAYHRSR